MGELDEEPRDSLVRIALQLALPEDRTWVDDLNELVRLYELREANANEWWATPAGSKERNIRNVYNGQYMDALRRWERVWKIVVRNNSQGNMLTYGAVSDMLKVNELEILFSES